MKATVRSAFEAMQAKGLNFLGATGANTYGEAAMRFEDQVDTLWDKGPGTIFNTKTALPFAALGGIGVLGGAAYYGARFDPFINQQMPIIAGAGVAGFAGLGALTYAGIRKGKAALAANPIYKDVDGFARKAAIGYEGFIKPTLKSALGVGQRGVMAAGWAAGPVIQTAGYTAGLAIQAASSAEFLARGFLTARPLNFLRGGEIMASNAIDAYLPNFRNLKANNIMKYAPNPNLIRRYAAGRAITSVAGALFDSLSAPAPPPTAVFDGRYMHHKNDLGAGPDFAQSVLGRNSDLNSSRGAATLAAAVF